LGSSDEAEKGLKCRASAELGISAHALIWERPSPARMTSCTANPRNGEPENEAFAVQIYRAKTQDVNENSSLSMPALPASWL